MDDLRALASELHRKYLLDDLPAENPIRRAHDALLAAGRERNALAAELNAVSGALGGDAYWMDPPDGGSVTVAEQVARANTAGRERDALAALLSQARSYIDRYRWPEVIEHIDAALAAKEK